MPFDVFESISSCSNVQISAGPFVLLSLALFFISRLYSFVPASVQKTITENSGGGKIEEIEKETETVSGKKTTIYEADVKQPDGKKIEIKVGEDGKLIKIDKD